MTQSKHDTKALRALRAKATPGEWRWNVNLASRLVYLESTGRGRRLEYVMDFARWGMSGAAPRFRSEQDLMVRADELTAVVPGREHHERWYRTLAHPDAAWMVAAVNASDWLLDAADERDKLSEERATWKQSRANFLDAKQALRDELYETRQLLQQAIDALHAFDPIKANELRADAIRARSDVATQEPAQRDQALREVHPSDSASTQELRRRVDALVSERDAQAARVADLEREVERLRPKGVSALFAGIRVLRNPAVERGTVMMNPDDVVSIAPAQGEGSGRGN